MTARLTTPDSAQTVSDNTDSVSVSVSDLVPPSTTTITTTSLSAFLVQWQTENKTRNVVIGSVLVVVNLLTLVNIVRTKSLRPHTKMLVGSLTCTDMLMGIITLLPRLLPVWHRLSHQPLCLVRYSAVLLSLYGSCLSVTALTFDRVLALTLPIPYRTSVSLEKALGVVVLVWGMSSILTAASLGRGFPAGTSCELVLVVDSGRLLLMAVVLLLCVALIGAMYGFIGYRLSRRRRRVRVGLQVWSTSTNSAAAAVRSRGQERGRLGVEGDGGSSSSGGGGGNSQTFNMKLEKRTTVTAMALAICFLVGYLPVAVYLFWVLSSRVDRLQEAKTQRLLIIIAFPLGNCILDPIVYFWRLQNWHSGIFGKCRKLVRRGQGFRDSSTGGVVVTQVTQRTTAT